MRVKKWHWFAGGGVVVAAGVTAVAVAIASSGAPQPPAETATKAPIETPTPTPTPTPVDMPNAVAAFGGLAGWSQAPTTAIARVVPQVGDAATGAVAAYVDAPVVDGEVTVLQSEVTVEPGVIYEFSAQARVLAALPTAVAATIVVGEQVIEVPELSAAWSEITAEYVAPAGAGAVPVRIVLDGPVSGLGLDDVSLVPAGGGDNIVANPSFEDVHADDVILNRSLILPADRPLLAVRVPQGTTTWTATNDAGDVVAQGSAEASHGLEAIELEGVGQGYYTVTVTDAAGAAVSTKLGVIDYEGTSIAVDERFGVGLHVEHAVYDDSADLASALGFGLARNDILWRHNETTRGQYDFDQRYVDGFARLHAHGIHLLGIVNYGNKLYGSELTPETPEAIAAYGRYAAAIAARFDLVGLEVFNEFNQERFNRTACGTNPSCYVPLLKVVQEEVRKVDAELPLVAGSTARYDAPWFDGLWQAGGLSFADVVSFHPYEVSWDPELLPGVIGQANDSMQQHAGDTRPIWITELGVPSKPDGHSIHAQADYLIRTSISSLAHGVEKFFWYDLVNDSPDPTVHEGNFGMYYQKGAGVAALQPKPAGYVQGLMVTQLGGRAYLDSEALGSDVKSYRFGTADDAVRVVWATKGRPQVTIPSTEPLTVVAASGATSVIEPVDGVVTLGLGIRPVFISAAAD